MPYRAAPSALLFALSLWTPAAWAGDPPSAIPAPLPEIAEPTLPEGAQKLVDMFFGAYVQGGVDAALSALKPHITFSTDALRQPLINVEQNPTGGRPLAYEVVRVIAVSDRFYEARLIAYHRTAAMVWRVRFMQSPSAEWVVYTLEAQDRYLVDFLMLSELEYDSMIATLGVKANSDQELANDAAEVTKGKR